MLYAIAAALALGAVMTLGDVLWDVLHIRHSVVYGVIHGAAMCLCLGLAIGIRARRPLPATAAGPVIGALGAVTFYALAPAIRWGALFPAWMLLWMLFALLQRWLAPGESIGVTLKRGLLAALLSALAFYLVSGMWTSHGPLNVTRNLLSWWFAFVPGFAALFARLPGAADAAAGAR